MIREQRQNFWIAGTGMVTGLLWILAVWIVYNEHLIFKAKKFTVLSFLYAFLCLVPGLCAIYSAISFARCGKFKAFTRIVAWFLFFLSILFLGLLASVLSNVWIFNLVVPLVFVVGLILYLVLVRRFAVWRGYPRPQTSEVVSIGAILILCLLIWNLCNQIVALLPPQQSFSGSPYVVFVRLIIPIIIAGSIYRWTTKAIWKEGSKQAQESFRLTGDQ